MTDQLTPNIMTTLRCLRCDHQWFPRAVKPPAHCPKCSSPYWDKARVNKKTGDPIKKTRRCHCFRCGHNWESSLKHPKQCARCRSAYWDTEREGPK